MTKHDDLVAKPDDEALRNRIVMFGKEAGGYIFRLESKLSTAEAELRKLHTLRPASEWHEDYGTVLWHHLPIQEPPHVGTPLDSDWDYFDEGYYTHWSPIPMNPTLAEDRAEREL